MTSGEDKTPTPGPESAKTAPKGAACPSYEEGFSVAPVTKPATSPAATEPQPSAAVGETNPISSTASLPAAPQPTPVQVDPSPAVSPEPKPAPHPESPFAAPAPTATANPFPAQTAAPVTTPTPQPEPVPPPATPAAPVPARSAWQPFTLGGVASFAYASPDRIFFMQALMAFIAGFAVLWFVDRNYTPVIVAAVKNMPEEAVVRNGNLDGVNTQVLAERKFFSIVIDLKQGPVVGQSADLQLELHKQNIALCPSYRSLAGIILFRYPPSGYWPVGRTILGPWWDAWKPVCYAGVVVGVAVGLLLTWLVLATLYGVAARVVAYFGDRAITLGQCWNLAAAALMPGALIMVTGIVCYGLQMVDLIGLSILSVAHFVVGWIYLLLAPLRVPRISTAAEPASNPFGSQ